MRTLDRYLHILRNPAGWSDDSVREARLWAADQIEKAQPAPEPVDFESWLRTVCFQKPTPEAYDLAKSAWLASKEK